MAAPHANAADGTVTQRYRVDAGPWRAMPKNRVFYTGTLLPGPHQVAVRTASRAGATQIAFGWQVDPPAPPLPCQSWGRASAGPRRTWTAPDTRCAGTGRSAGPPRCSAPGATRWTSTTSTASSPPGPKSPRSGPAGRRSTLAHPRTVCYLDLAWEDYRPDATPGRAFPAATLGNVYFGYPEERWVDLRQLDALKPMLRERVAMCARKGFDAVELDDIDSFDPPSTTGFRLTPGDAQNFLAYAFNLIHADGMTGAVEELALPVLVGTPVCGRRGGRGVLPGPRLLRGPVQGQPPVRDHLHRAVRRHAVRLGRLHRRRPVGR